MASQRHSDYFDPRAPPPPPPRDGYGGPAYSPPAAQGGQQNGRVFSTYSIYKGKAAMSLDPRPPQFVPLDVGRGGAAACELRDCEVDFLINLMGVSFVRVFELCSLGLTRL